MNKLKIPSCCANPERAIMYYSPAFFRAKCVSCKKEISMVNPPFPLMIGKPKIQVEPMKGLLMDDEGFMSYVKDLENKVKVLENGHS